MFKPRLLAVGVVSAILPLGGCGVTSQDSGNPPTPTWTNSAAGPADTTAFATLAKVAPFAAGLQSGSIVQGTQCWTPSEHLLSDLSVAPLSAFRVICRVHYELDSTQRYTDVVCVGDFDKRPMLHRCYIWKPHLGGPTFEGGQSLASSPPTPLP